MSLPMSSDPRTHLSKQAQNQVYDHIDFDIESSARLDPRNQQIRTKIYISIACVCCLIIWTMRPQCDPPPTYNTPSFNIPSITHWSSVNISYLEHQPITLHLQNQSHVHVSYSKANSPKFEIDSYVWKTLSQALQSSQRIIEKREIDLSEYKHFSVHEQAIHIVIHFKEDKIPPLSLWVGQEYLKQSTWVRMSRDFTHLATSEKTKIKNKDKDKNQKMNSKKEYQKSDLSSKKNIYRLTGTWRRWFERTLSQWQDRKVFHGDPQKITCIHLYTGEYQSKSNTRVCATSTPQKLSLQQKNLPPKSLIIPKKIQDTTHSQDSNKVTLINKTTHTRSSLDQITPLTTTSHSSPAVSPIPPPLILSQYPHTAHPSSTTHYLSTHQWTLFKAQDKSWTIQDHPYITLDQDRAKSLAFNLASSRVHEVIRADALPKPWRASYTFEWQDTQGNHGWFSLMQGLIDSSDLSNQKANSLYQKGTTKQKNHIQNYIRFKQGYGSIPKHIFYFIKTNIQSLLQHKIYLYNTQKIRKVEWLPNMIGIQAKLPLAWKADYQDTAWLLHQQSRNTSAQKVHIISAKKLQNWFNILQSEGVGSHIASITFERMRRQSNHQALPQHLGRLSFQRVAQNFCHHQGKSISTISKPQDQPKAQADHNLDQLNQSYKICNDWIDLWKFPQRPTYLLHRSWDDLLIDSTERKTKELLTLLLENRTLIPSHSPLINQP
jgi:hypothetical protein